VWSKARLSSSLRSVAHRWVNPRATEHVPQIAVAQSPHAGLAYGEVVEDNLVADREDRPMLQRSGSSIVSATSKYMWPRPFGRGHDFVFAITCWLLGQLVQPLGDFVSEAVDVACYVLQRIEGVVLDERREVDAEDQALGLVHAV